ncbi:MAG: GNAT family N-acetyltransferase [Phycisphaerae bacterium]
MSDHSRADICKLVRLRDVVPHDLPILFQYQLDPESNQMAVTNPRDAAAFDAVWEKVFRERTVVAKAIVLEGRVVGNISCFKRDGLDFVGYWVARELWGRGIATRALELLLQEVAIRPLHACAARTNTRSLRVLERCRFVVTGYQMSPGDERFPACELAHLVLE